MTRWGGLWAEALRFDEGDRIIRTAVERGEIPGVALHVRAEGRVVHERAFGRRHIDEEAALSIDDVFPVASLTKPVVAVGILRLCEDGALRLDDPIAHYLPEFAGPKVLVSYDLETGVMVTRPARGFVTVHHLLTHTAGIHHGFARPDDVMGTLYERSGVVHGDGMPMAEKVKRLGPLPLVHDPGQAWTYGLSSDVAGRLIEVVSGQPLDRYLARCIFDPVGMKSTYFFVPAGERSRLVTPHVLEADRVVLPSWSRDAGQRYLSGGGGLHTTVGDYGQFVQLLLDGGAPVVSRESVGLMTRNHIGDLTAFGFKYGLGVGIATSEAHGERPLPVGGFGWYGIYSTWFWTLPRRRGGVLFFGNVLAPGMNLPLFARVAAVIDTALG
jgi:CubicO group peptidase (beta-lactamase class C family)